MEEPDSNSGLVFVTHESNEVSSSILEDLPRKDFQMKKVQWMHRWLLHLRTWEEIEMELTMKAKCFRKYKINIFELQRAAIKIQHWFLKAKIAMRKKTYENRQPFKETQKNFENNNFKYV